MSSALRLGVCSWAFEGVVRGRRSLPETAAAAHQAAFSCLEATYTIRRDVAEFVGATGALAVPVASMATLELLRFELTDPQAIRREQALRVVNGMIEAAAAEGIPSVSFSPGRCPPDVKPHEAIDTLVKQLAPAVEQARRSGVTVCLENVPGHLLERRELMEHALEQLDQAGMCFDCGNALVDPPLQGWLDSFGSRMRKVHLSDGRRSADGVTTVPLGTGDVEWAALAAGLHALPDPPDLFVEAQWTNGTDEPVFLEDLRRRATVLMAGVAEAR